MFRRGRGWFGGVVEELAVHIADGLVDDEVMEILVLGEGQRSDWSWAKQRDLREE